MKTIKLTMQEVKRFDVMQIVLRGELKMRDASEVLDLSLRQTQRLKKSVKEKGVDGVLHGNRGNHCGWKVSDGIASQIVSLRKEKYKGFNDTHFHEKLLEEGIKLSREKVRQVLRKAGIASPRKRKPVKYRIRRERKESEGLMLQTDGSHHDWLESGSKLCLLGVIDDATGKVPSACFHDQETTEGYFEVFERAFKRKGLPHAIYADRHSIFRTDKKLTIEEELAGKRKPLTQVGRALDELGITLILAGSPQAKGRIERLWDTFQDRLISELRLAGAKTKQDAGRVLERFLPSFNKRFGRKPACDQSAWRKVPDDIKLNKVLCWKHERTVARDNTVSFKGLTLQLPKLRPFVSLVGKKVTVLVLRNKIIEIHYKNSMIARFTNRNIKMEVA